MRNPFTNILPFILHSFRPKEKQYVISKETALSAENKVSIEKPIPKKSHRRKASKPAWWIRFYSVRKRAEIGSLNREMFKCFGNFSPIKPIYYPGTKTVFIGKKLK